MTDRGDREFLKLRQIHEEVFAGTIHPLMVAGERIITSCQSVRDGVVFTTRRVFLITVTGLSGKRSDITSIPYRSIREYTLRQTALNVDREILLTLMDGARVKLNFQAQVDTAWLCRLLGQYVLRRDEELR